MTTFADEFPGAEPPEQPRRAYLDPRRGLPRLPVMWTLDQVAASFHLSVSTLISSYVWLDGRDVGAYRKRYLRAVNLNRGKKTNADTVGDVSDDWRIPEGELLRWMHHHRLWVYDPAAFGFDTLTAEQGRDLRRLEHSGRVFVIEDHQPSYRDDADDIEETNEDD